MPLTAVDWEQLSECLLRLYRETEPEKHCQVMLEVLHSLAPCDSLGLNIFDLETRKLDLLTLPPRAVSPSDTDAVAGMLNESPFTAYYVATHDSQWKMTTDFMPVEDFHATSLWRQALSRWGINQQICGVLAIENHVVHGLTLNRAQKGFTEHERELLNALHPHLVTSYLNAMAFGRSQHSVEQMRRVLEVAPGAYGYIRADGNVAWLQERTRSWIGEFFAREVKYDDGLPRSIREMVHRSQGNQNQPQHLERIAYSERLTVCLSASPLGGWILRLDRASLVPQLILRDVPGLTDREQEVLRWMIEGKRNGEIAVILGISDRTVEKHVAAVLRVLHAENRATAIVRAMELSAVVPVA